MGRVVARITTSLDGYITGPDDGPGRGLGIGGERLHYWVFGGPWSYADPVRGEATGVDKELLDQSHARVGAVVGGRRTYEAAGAWGGRNPWGIPFFIVTTGPRRRRHPRQDSPLSTAWTPRWPRPGTRRETSRSPSWMGGADVIRQALRGGHVDELALSIAPVILGAGKRLFEGFGATVGLEPVSAVQSRWATHLHYQVER